MITRFIVLPVVIAIMTIAGCNTVSQHPRTSTPYSKTVEGRKVTATGALVVKQSADALVMQCSGIMCFGVEFDKRLAKLEDLWCKGHAEQFYLEAVSFANDIAALSGQQDASGLSARLLNSLLSKNIKGKEIEVGVTDLNVQELLAKLVITNQDVSIEQRRANALILSEYLGLIRTEIIANFRPLWVSANVAPPRNAGQFVMAGMNPDAITDPVVRAEYVEAKKQNRRYGMINTRQRELSRLETRISKLVIDYIADTVYVDSGGGGGQLVNVYCNNARVTAEEARRIEMMMEKMRIEQDRIGRSRVGRVDE